MPILKQQVNYSPNSLQILCLSSVSWKICPLYFFSSNNIYFAQKEPIKMKIFENFFECSGQNLSNFLCQFWNDKLIPPQVLYPSSVSWKTIPLYFLAQTIYTLLKRSPLKWKCLRLSRVKFRQIPDANFETTSRFLSKFCISPQSHERLFHCTFFLAKTIHSLLIRSPLNWKSLRLSSPQVKICQIYCANFETASRSLPKFCISLQFHETPVYFFSSSNIYSAEKEHIKIIFLRLSSAWVKIHQIPHVNFEMTSQFLFKFCIILHFHDI